MLCNVPVVWLLLTWFRDVQAFMTIALTDLGYHVANYDASMQEWLNDDEREVEAGMPE